MPTHSPKTFCKSPYTLFAMNYQYTYSNIIDIRPEHNFNGWPSESLDGHLRHSMNIPFYWLGIFKQEVV